MAIGALNPVTTTQQAAPAAPAKKTPAQFAAAKADKVLGPQVSPEAAGKAMGAPGPVGSDALRQKLEKAGMENVSQPPSEADLRTYYAQHAEHHELISQGKFSDAAAQYRADAQKLGDGDPRRGELFATANQLDYTAKLGEKASFPPTQEQLKAHFQGLKKSDNKTVTKDFEQYTSAFYSHINSDAQGSKTGDLTYTPHNVKSGKTTYTGIDTPTGFSDVTDRRQLNSSGQRLIDCEGYAMLGNQLLGEAGFKQPAEGGFHVVSANGVQGGHAMVEMQRNGESVFVSNNHAYNSPSKAYGDFLGALRQRGSSVGIADLRDYYGRTEDAAIIARETKDKSHQTEFRTQ
ncbi:MAG: hypothetical protein J0I12_30615 [Candidatus Eremiobacteraeota bacterium]|nr:hypothetical protein [Candidatus Eremiobacteraeota bacterium]